MAGGSAVGGMSILLNNVQKVFLTGQIAIVDIPETFQNFTDAFAWALLSPTDSEDVS